MALTGNFEKVFHNDLQYYFPQLLTGLASKIADLNFDSTIKSRGQSVDFPRINYKSIQVKRITDREATFSPQFNKAVRETLDVNTELFVPFRIAQGDAIQGSAFYGDAEVSEQLMKRIAETVDTSIMGAISTMALTFDAGDIGGTAGTPLALSVLNSSEVLTKMKAKLQRNRVTGMDLVFVTDPYAVAIFEQNLVNRDASLSVSYFIDGKAFKVDRVAEKNGYTGTLVGVPVFSSNNLPSVQVLTLPTNPTAGDTMTYAGVVITFVATLTSTNQVLIGANVAATQANLAAFFNDQTIVATSSATHGALSTTVASMTVDTDPVSDFDIIYGLQVTAVVGSGIVTFTTQGGGYIQVSETFTAVGNVWTSNSILSYFGKERTIKVAMQTPENGRIAVLDKVPGFAGMEIQIYALYGVKAFYEGRNMGLKVSIDASVLD